MLASKTLHRFSSLNILTDSGCKRQTWSMEMTSLTKVTFLSPIQGGSDPPDTCNVMIMHHYMAAFMYVLLNVSKPECVRFEDVL